MAFCLQRLVSYKVPTVMDFRDTLPIDAAGKMSRRELLEWQSAESGTDTSRNASTD